MYILDKVIVLLVVVRESRVFELRVLLQHCSISMYTFLTNQPCANLRREMKKKQTRRSGLRMTNNLKLLAPDVLSPVSILFTLLTSFITHVNAFVYLSFSCLWLPKRLSCRLHGVGTIFPSIVTMFSYP